MTAFSPARQLAFSALCAVEAGAYADAALDRALSQSQKQSQKQFKRRAPKNKKQASEKKAPSPAEAASSATAEHASAGHAPTGNLSIELSPADRRLATELLYGCIRRQRTLDALIDQFAKKPASQQPPKLRLLLHLGLYQMRYLDHIPNSAAVDTTVELAKSQGLSGLSGFVNGVLRQYGRQAEKLDEAGELLKLPENVVERIGVLHSYPDWLVELWRSQLPLEELEAIARWFNQSPTIDLRINPLVSNPDDVETALKAADLKVTRLPNLPQGLRLSGAVGSVKELPGFEDGHWMVQDSSAQLVGHLLDPQPGETVIDACAAPGGKTAHIAELMENRGVIWACDRTASRLRKLKQNAKRLGLKNIRIHEGDSTDQAQFVKRADRVLLDVPCSGLGTLHRHADARWRQNPEAIAGLAELQKKLLAQGATWVKSGGVLVYATCTLHPLENERVVEAFLQANSNWKIEAPRAESPAHAYVTEQGWCKVWPHRSEQDGFFMVRLKRCA